MGVPQGGVISPTIANTALNGLENLVEDIYKCQVVRYADDFLILADCEKVILEKVLPKVKIIKVCSKLSKSKKSEVNRRTV